MLLPGRVRGKLPLRPVYAPMRVIRHPQLQGAETVAGSADIGPVCAARARAGVGFTWGTWEVRVGVAGPWGGSAGSVDGVTAAGAAVVVACHVAADVIDEAFQAAVAAAAAAVAVGDNVEDAATVAVVIRRAVVAAARICRDIPRALRLATVFLPGIKISSSVIAVNA